MHWKCFSGITSITFPFLISNRESGHQQASWRVVTERQKQLISDITQMGFHSDSISTGCVVLQCGSSHIICKSEITSTLLWLMWSEEVRSSTWLRACTFNISVWDTGQCNKTGKKLASGTAKAEIQPKDLGITVKIDYISIQQEKYITDERKIEV